MASKTNSAKKMTTKKATSTKKKSATTKKPSTKKKTTTKKAAKKVPTKTKADPEVKKPVAKKTKAKKPVTKAPPASIETDEPAPSLFIRAPSASAVAKQLKPISPPPEPLDPQTGKPLGVEVYKLNAQDKRLKSCPGCSIKAGRLIFYRFKRFGGRMKVENDFIAKATLCIDCQKES